MGIGGKKLEGFYKMKNKQSWLNWKTKSNQSKINKSTLFDLKNNMLSFRIDVILKHQIQSFSIV